MAREPKEVVPFEVFESLDIRLGRVVSVEPEPTAVKESYKLTVDFGKFGTKTSVARLTNHRIEEIKDKLVFGVLNFEPRQVGDTLSEVLILGVQFPKAESGAAAFVTPAIENVKLGSKLF